MTSWDSFEEKKMKFVGRWHKKMVRQNIQWWKWRSKVTSTSFRCSTLGLINFTSFISWKTILDKIAPTCYRRRKTFLSNKHKRENLITQHLVVEKNVKKNLFQTKIIWHWFYFSTPLIFLPLLVFNNSFVSCDEDKSSLFEVLFKRK